MLHQRATLMHVLYVDDDRLNAALFGEVCALVPGLELEVADDPAQALELATRWLPPQAHALLVIDLHLPQMDGITLLRQLRQQGVTARAVLFTAEEPNAPLRQRAAEAGFEALWLKPIDGPAQLARLQALVAGGPLQ